MGLPGPRTPSLAAVQSVLTFGAVLPPLTPWEGHSRGQADDPYGIALAQTFDAVGQSATADVPGSEPQRSAVRLLDDTLELALAAGRRPLVLFSGGVDSCLMAVRLREIGRTDTILVHYQFNDHHDDTPIAIEMARELGFPLEIVRRDSTGLALLDNPGRVYPVPFGDVSAVPTSELCHGLSRLVDPEDVVVFDGTGADGAFGLGRKVLDLQRLLRLPTTALRAVDLVYLHGGWLSHGTAEYWMRVARRGSHLSRVGTVLAQNSLFGILYDAPDLGRIDAAWNQLLRHGGGSGDVERVVISDTAVICAGIFAQKTLGPLTSLGFDVCYPFLTMEMGVLGLLATRDHPEGEAKQWMKQELAQHVAAKLVYRPKTGFVEPEMTHFDVPEFRAILDNAISDDDLLRPFVRRKELRRLLDRRGRLGALPHGHLNFLWALAFMHRWYKTA